MAEIAERSIDPPEPIMKLCDQCQDEYEESELNKDNLCEDCVTVEGYMDMLPDDIGSANRRILSSIIRTAYLDGRIKGMYKATRRKHETH